MHGNALMLINKQGLLNNMLTVTATNLPRLMSCNGSRLIGGLNPPVNSVNNDDAIRDEGNAADWIVSQVYSGNFTAVELIDRKAFNGVYITPEMVDYLDEYLKTLSDTEIEVNTSYQGSNWLVNGRADRIHYDATNQHLYIDDLKYGWRIVEPEMNWTLISHALGYWFKNPGMQIAQVTFTIYQPRPHHPNGRVRKWTITGEKMVELYNRINETLSNPSDILNTGEQCYKCPALLSGICPAANKAQMNGLDASETAFIGNIDNESLSHQLDHINRAIEILTQHKKAYEEMAVNRLRKGELVANYLLENELTNREWKSCVTPELLEVLTGKDLTVKKLKTPKQVELAGVSKEAVAALVERRMKGTKLVRKTANAWATKMFKQTN